MRVLVVEDEFLSREKLSAFFSRYGAVDSAPSGRDARVLFERAIEEGLPYDCISVDLHLPDEDGLSLLASFIRREREVGGGWFSKKLVISGDTQRHVVESAVRAGCDAYIAKPVRLKVLEERLRLIFR
ncbi:response regulator [Spirochaeta thermophila]|uniref:Response regulator receiver protein n=1 Tax=Winmispira thermophila (strain ATCC 49972 / DSM 6192 / RI 19.B1) TaxID=665571 RepID=E0RTZ4_WINT6|nr:response regulator [Spirochaeta thermophila]ADN01050.1 response regulator receiver protein [Spirochaeta thermophila DSM 6192]